MQGWKMWTKPQKNARRRRERKKENETTFRRFLPLKTRFHGFVEIRGFLGKEGEKRSKKRRRQEVPVFSPRGKKEIPLPSSPFRFSHIFRTLFVTFHIALLDFSFSFPDKDGRCSTNSRANALVTEVNLSQRADSFEYRLSSFVSSFKCVLNALAHTN